MPRPRKKARAKSSKRGKKVGTLAEIGLTADSASPPVDEAPEPAKEGRPTKYEPRFAKMAQTFCQGRGATDVEIADLFDVEVRTVYRWKNEHPEFCQALKVGKDVADDRVERSLYQRACGFSHPDVHISNFQGDISVTPITKHYPPDTTAGIFWLKNRRKKDWRDKIDHTHSGIPKGAPAQIIIGGKATVKVEDEDGET